MAAKVALLLVNDILPILKFQAELEKLDYFCITIDNLTPDIDFPAFNVAIVGINAAKQKAWIIDLSKRYPDKPFLYYTNGIYTNEFDDFEVICKSNFIDPEFTARELELMIELTNLKRKQSLATTLSNVNKSFNHIRLKKLLSEEQAWRVLFEQSPNGILLGDSHGNIIYTNNAAGTILGYTPEELIAMRFHDLVLPDIKWQVDVNIKKLLDGETLISEVYNVRKDRSRRFVQLHETRVILPDGNYGIMVVSTDITRAKQAEEALVESMGKYQVLVERSNDGILYTKNGILTYGNPRIMEMLSVSNEDFIGKPLHIFLHPTERERISRKLEHGRIVLNEPSIFETTLIDASNQPLYVEFNVNTTSLNGDSITLVFIRDVSIRKGVEKALRDSEESYRGLFDNSSEAIYILDPSGVLLDININGQKMYGYTKQEIVGLTPLELIAAELGDIQDFKQKIDLAYQGQNQVLEVWSRKKSGDIFPSEVVLSKGNYFGLQVILAMSRDISERKNAEAILLESEEKYRSLTEQIPVGIYRLSPKGEIIYSNPALARIFKLSSPNDLLGKNISEFSDDSFLARIVEVTTNCSHHQEDIPMHTADGLQIWVQNYAIVAYNSTNDIQYIDGVMNDITDRKLAMDSLRESEEKFRITVSAIPDELYKISSSGILLDLVRSNKAEIPELATKMIGKSISKILPPDIFQKFIDATKNCKNTNTIQIFEYQIKVKSQTYHFESRIVPTGNDIFLVLQRDISQRKKIEEDLRMLAQVVLNVHDSISITDLDNNFTFVNPAFIQTYGYSYDEIIGKNTSLLRPPGTEEEIGQHILEQTIKTGWQGELINVKKDGSIFPIYLSTSSVYDLNGKPIAMVGIANDISELKRTERELIRAKEKAEESDKLKTAFLSNMSHEIRSPMNAVLGFIQLIKSDEHLSEQGKQYLELIQNSGNQLLSLIEDIIDISKIQSNQLRLNKENFDLNHLMEELYVVFSTQLKSKSSSKTLLLKPEMANPSPFEIFSDVTRVRQILTNLLSNAIKFTPNGKIKFGYTVIIDDYLPRVQLYVKDTGIGILPENQLLIFDRFRQADDSHSRLYGGSGLGLAISKGLAELLNGHIWVESQVGEGSEFYFTVPYEIDEAGERTRKEQVGPPQQDGNPSLKGKTILVVENTKDIRLYFERILERVEARIIFASNAKEAKKKFRQEKTIDLVLLDIRLPDSDGYSLASEFKKVHPNLPIIAQTSYALQSELNKSIASGCDDYITKPIDSDVLYLKINKLLGEKNAASKKGNPSGS
ncbi:MAG: PAS domain S-box protein [Bacteroidales bacterium]